MEQDVTQDGQQSATSDDRSNVDECVEVAYISVNKFPEIKNRTYNKSVHEKKPDKTIKGYKIPRPAACKMKIFGKKGKAVPQLRPFSFIRHERKKCELRQIPPGLVEEWRAEVRRRQFATCPLGCQRRFATKAGLKYHYQRCQGVEDSSGERKCTFCDASFNHQLSLYKHHTVHHAGEDFPGATVTTPKDTRHTGSDMNSSVSAVSDITDTREMRNGDVTKLHQESERSDLQNLSAIGPVSQDSYDIVHVDTTTTSPADLKRKSDSRVTSARKHSTPKIQKTPCLKERNRNKMPICVQSLLKRKFPKRIEYFLVSSDEEEEAEIVSSEQEKVSDSVELRKDESNKCSNISDVQPKQIESQVPDMSDVHVSQSIGTLNRNENVHVTNHSESITNDENALRITTKSGRCSKPTKRLLESRSSPTKTSSKSHSPVRSEEPSPQKKKSVTKVTTSSSVKQIMNGTNEESESSVMTESAAEVKKQSNKCTQSTPGPSTPSTYTAVLRVSHSANDSTLSEKLQDGHFTVHFEEMPSQECVGSSSHNLDDDPIVESSSSNRRLRSSSRLKRLNKAKTVNSGESTDLSTQSDSNELSLSSTSLAGGSPENQTSFLSSLSLKQVRKNLSFDVVSRGLEQTLSVSPNDADQLDVLDEKIAESTPTCRKRSERIWNRKLGIRRACSPTQIQARDKFEDSVDSQDNVSVSRTTDLSECENTENLNFGDEVKMTEDSAKMVKVSRGKNECPDLCQADQGGGDKRSKYCESHKTERTVDKTLNDSQTVISQEKTRMSTRTSTLDSAGDSMGSPGKKMTMLERAEYRKRMREDVDLTSSPKRRKIGDDNVQESNISDIPPKTVKEKKRQSEKNTKSSKKTKKPPKIVEDSETSDDIVLTPEVVDNASKSTWSKGKQRHSDKKQKSEGKSNPPVDKNKSVRSAKKKKHKSDSSKTKKKTHASHKNDSAAVNSNEKRDWICLRCGKQVEDKSALRYHMMRAHNAVYRKKNPEGEVDLNYVLHQIQKLTCELCSKTFTSRPHFLFHEKWCGKEGQMITCEICGKETRAMFLFQHVKRDCQKEGAHHKPVTGVADKEKSSKSAAPAPSKTEKSKSEDSVNTSSDQLTPGRSQRKAAAKALKNLESLCKEELKGEGSKKSKVKDGTIGEKKSKPDADDSEFVVSSEDEEDSNTWVNSGSRHSLQKYCEDCSEWTLNFMKANFQDKLFADWKALEKNWDIVPKNKLEQYLPHHEESPYVKVIKGKKINTVRLKRFESCNTGFPLLNTGGPAWSAEWCPLPVNVTGPQYIAISSTKSVSAGHTLSGCPNESSLIQIWSAGELSAKRSSDLIKPSLALALAHNFGPVWDMKWCPSGAYDHNNVTDGLPRLGLLAVTGNDGLVRIFSIPKPEHLHQSKQQLPCYTASPVAVLHRYVTSLTDVQQPACCSVDWSMKKEHRLIAAGYLNGEVALWDLTTTSPLLLEKSEGGPTTLCAYHVFQAHSTVVRGLALQMHTEQHLVTVSKDRYVRFWDLSCTDCPVNYEKRGEMTAVQWPLHWANVYIASDDCYSYQHNCSHFVETGYFGYQSCPLTVHNSCIWSISHSNWLNSIVTCDSSGEVQGMYLPPMIFFDAYGKHKIRRRFSIVKVDMEPLSGTEEQNVAKDKDAEGFSGKTSTSTASAGKKVSTSQRSSVKPASYDDFVNKCCLVYKEGQLADRRNIGNDMRLRFANTMTPYTLDHATLQTMTKVAWNPNLSSYPWVLVGSCTGLVSLHCVSALV